MGLPVRSTANENVIAYQAERTIFLDEQRKFKIGNVMYGVATVASLRSMYMELIYSYHQEKNKTASEEYLKELEELYVEVAKLYINADLQKPAQAINNLGFKKIVKRLDETYSKLQLFKKECGFG